MDMLDTIHTFHQDEAARFRDVCWKVNQWARENVPNEWMYNSRMTYYGSAMREGIITQDEYNLCRRMFGDIWNYVGD